MELVVTRRNGDQHVILYDERDHDLISQHRWNVVEQTHTLYARVSTRAATRMHRLLLPDAPIVDHINGNGLDNRRENLRAATSRENARNRRGKCGATAGFKGVFSDGNGRWRARIYLGGRNVNLGSHDTPEAAALAYDAAARDEWGDFAFLNFPDLHTVNGAA